MNKTIALLLVSASLLAGCAPATMDALRSQHAGKLSFEVKKNYQPVYRAIVNQARKCYQAGMITAQMVVQGDLYTDTRSGNVTVALHGGLGVATYLTVDITALDESSSHVDAYFALDNWRGAAAVVQEWVKDGSTECGPRSQAAA